MTQEEFVGILRELKEGLLASEETNSYGVKYKEGFTNSMDASILWDSLSWPIIKSFGGEIFDANGNYLDENGKMLFDSEDTVAAMKFAHDLVANKYMGSPSTWSTKDGAQFLLENSPVYLHCRAILSSLTTPTNAYHGIANLGVAPCRFGNSDSYYVGSGRRVISIVFPEQAQNGCVVILENYRQRTRAGRSIENGKPCAGNRQLDYR